jgi:hypothetical protein
MDLDIQGYIVQKLSGQKFGDLTGGSDRPPTWVTSGPGLRAWRQRREKELAAAGKKITPTKEQVLGPYSPQQAGALATIKNETDFVETFKKAQGRNPTAREIAVARKRGLFK